MKLLLSQSQDTLIYLLFNLNNLIISLIIVLGFKVTIDKILLCLSVWEPMTKVQILTTVVWKFQHSQYEIRI